MKAPADRPETEVASSLAPTAGRGTPCALWRNRRRSTLARAARTAIEPLSTSAGHRTARPSLWRNARENIAILYGEVLAMSSALGWDSPEPPRNRRFSNLENGVYLAIRRARDRAGQSFMEGKYSPMTWRRWLASPARTHGGPFGGPTTSLNGRYPANRRRILILTSTIAKGGCERQILSTAAGLIEKGFQVAIVAFARAPADESLDTEFTERSIPLSYADEFRSMRQASYRASLPCRCPRTCANTPPAYGRRYSSTVPMSSMPGRTMQPSSAEAWRWLSRSRALSWGNATYRRQATSRECRDISRGVSNSRVEPASDPHNNSQRNACEYERWLELPRGTIRVVRNGFFPGTVRKSSSRGGETEATGPRHT